MSYGMVSFRGKHLDRLFNKAAHQASNQSQTDNDKALKPSRQMIRDLHQIKREYLQTMVEQECPDLGTLKQRMKAMTGNRLWIVPAEKLKRFNQKISGKLNSWLGETLGGTLANILPTAWELPKGASAFVLRLPFTHHVLMQYQEGSEEFATPHETIHILQNGKKSFPIFTLNPWGMALFPWQKSAKRLEKAYEKIYESAVDFSDGYLNEARFRQDIQQTLKVLPDKELPTLRRFFMMERQAYTLVPRYATRMKGRFAYTDLGERAMLAAWSQGMARASSIISQEIKRYSKAQAANKST